MKKLIKIIRIIIPFIFSPIIRIIYFPIDRYITVKIFGCSCSNNNFNANDFNFYFWIFIGLLSIIISILNYKLFKNKIIFTFYIILIILLNIFYSYEFISIFQWK